jgi:hypothetical protein
MAGITKAERERRAKEQRVNDSRTLVTAEASLLANDEWSYMDVLHQMANDEDADRLHRKFAYTVESLDREIAYDQERVDKWSDDFKVNPVYAFERADHCVEAATRVMVNRQFLQWYKAKGPDAAYQFAEYTALSLARNPSRSTSQGYNQVALYTVSAWAKLVEDRRWSMGL